MMKVALDIAKVEVWFEALVHRLRFLLFGVFDCLISYRDYSIKDATDKIAALMHQLWQNPAVPKVIDHSSEFYSAS